MKRLKNKMLGITALGMLTLADLAYGLNTGHTTCPLEGTPECPKINCPLAGTPECPYDDVAIAELPACCKR